MKQYKIYTKEKGIVETNFNDDTIRNLTWHREDGPAFIGYYDNGEVAYEEYWINDEKHRLDGPACIMYYNNGNIQQAEYCINGMSYTEDEYNKELLKLKVQSL